MKKVAALFLILTLIFTSVSVTASDNYFYSDDVYPVSGSILGAAQMEKETYGTPGEYGFYSVYKAFIDINSEITFDTPIDTLSVYGREKDGPTYYDFADGERYSDGSCTVKYESAYRYDSADYTSRDVDGDNEVEYMLPYATIRFNRAGEYLLEATLGDADGYERISHLREMKYENRYFYAQPSVFFEITVTEETQEETIYDLLPYDESVISVSGITGYDYTRTVMGDSCIVLCSSPTVITAQTDLDNMCVSRLENINGEWVEVEFIDGYGIKSGNIEENWIPGFGFEESIPEDAVIIEEIIITEEDMAVPKGTSISLTKPGMYMFWGGNDLGGTGMTFEIGDTYAKYTSSKVLVNGQEIKFEAYNINGNNFFKLRDIAFALTNAGMGFNVKWDGERNMINLVSHTPYEAVGGELVAGDGTDKAYALSSSALMKDGVNVTLNAYLINGNNYFKLRDLGKLIDFNVSWDGANNCILIDPYSSYRE